MANSLRNSRDVSGIYRARVEVNKDPMKIGRVRVRVPMFHGLPSKGIPSESLPWAYPCFMSAGYQYGTYIVPEVGEYVFVIFEDNDLKKPVYIGSSFGAGATNDKYFGSKDNLGVWSSDIGVNEVPEEAIQEDFPNRKIIYKSPKGASIEIDENNGEECLEINDALGQSIKMSSEIVGGVNYKRGVNSADSDDGISGDDYEEAEIKITSAYGASLLIHSGQGDDYIEINSGDKGFRLNESNDTVEIYNGKYNVIIDGDGNVNITGAKDITLDSDKISLDSDVEIIEFLPSELDKINKEEEGVVVNITDAEDIDEEEELDELDEWDASEVIDEDVSEDDED